MSYREFGGKLYTDQEYCEKCGAPLVAHTSRFGRRRAWLVTISPGLRASKNYQICMECALLMEAMLEHRTQGRLRIVKPMTGDQTRLPLDPEINAPSVKEGGEK